MAAKKQSEYRRVDVEALWDIWLERNRCGDPLCIHQSPVKKHIIEKAIRLRLSSS